MKGRAEKQLALAFTFVVIKFEILHQNLEFPKNQVPCIVPAY